MVDTVLNSSILTSNQYRTQQNASALAEQDLGRDAFLKLLTTQLTNQSPLDPMDNEAFVAQLAQFSSVEGIKGMQASLENMVSGMRQEQMVSGANLVGKKVVVEGGSFIGGNNEDSVGTVNLSGSLVGPQPFPLFLKVNFGNDDMVIFFPNCSFSFS